MHDTDPDITEADSQANSAVGEPEPVEQHDADADAVDAADVAQFGEFERRMR